MKATKCILIAGAVLAAALASGNAEEKTAAKASESPAAREYTVGDFAVNLAQSLHLALPEGQRSFTPESATKVLWKNGVRIQADSRKELTEEVLTSTMTQLGFNLVPNEAGRAVTADRAESALSTFINSDTLERLRRNGMEIAGNGGDDFNNGNGKGGKFKRKNDKSPGTSD